MNQENEAYLRTWTLAKEVGKFAVEILMSRGWEMDEIQSFNELLCILLRKDRSIAGSMLVSSVLLSRVFEQDSTILGTLANSSMVDVFMDVLTDVIDDLLVEFSDDEEEEDDKAEGSIEDDAE